MVRTRRYQGTLPAVSMSAAASLLAWSTLIAWSARSMPGAAQQPGGSPDSSTRVPTRRYQGALPVVSMSGASLSPWSLRSSSACSTSTSEESARSTEEQAPRQSGISLEKEKRSIDSREVTTASGGASILHFWLVAREVFAGLEIAGRSPPAWGRERLTNAVGIEMLGRCAAAAETRKTSGTFIRKR
jgi:hypothetical protein